MNPLIEAGYICDAKFLHPDPQYALSHVARGLRRAAVNQAGRDVCLKEGVLTASYVHSHDQVRFLFQVKL